MPTMTQAHKANYAAFANFLGHHPDQLVLRRFCELNIRNLLFYQAELVHLSRELHYLELKDISLHPNLADRVNYRWKHTRRSTSAPSTCQCQCSGTITNPSYSKTGNVTQQGRGPGLPVSTTAAAPAAAAIINKPASIQDDYQEKILQIRVTLERYSKLVRLCWNQSNKHVPHILTFPDQAVNLYAKQRVLSTPSKRTVRTLRDWLDREDAFGQGFLTGSLEDVWDLQANGTELEEFMSFIHAGSSGLLSPIASLVLSIQRLFTRNKAPDMIFSIDNTNAGGLAQGLSVVVSSLFPVLPIIALFFVERLLVRLGLILVFTAVLAATLVFGLGLQPEKVLAITTA